MEIKINKAVDISAVSSPYTVLLSSDVQTYAFTGSKSLSAPFAIQASGTPVDGMEVWFYFYTSITTSGSYVFSIFGTTIADLVANGYFWALAKYMGGAWRVFYGTAAGTPADGVKIELNANGSLTLKSGSVVNADINASAAIAYTKLSLANSILNADINSAAAISYSKLALTGSIVNADVNAAAAIAYSKLNLAGSILNADINAAAAIAYTKLALTGSIVNADINAAAAIAYTKLALTDSIVNADINSAAAIGLSKLAALTASRVLVSDGSGVITPSSVTSTEIGYLSGATSNIQTQLNAVVANKVTSATLSGTTVLSAPLNVLYICDVSGGGFTVTLPAASSVASGTIAEFVVWGHNSNVLTIARAGADTIDSASSTGGTSLTASTYNAGYKLVSDGSSKWTAIAR